MICCKWVWSQAHIHRYAATMNPPVKIRNPCPPGACDCERERLEAEDADLRILKLTRDAEITLLERLGRVESLEDLQHMQRRIFEQLGVRIEIAPGFNEVRTMRGISIVVEKKTGLCRKTRKLVASAIRSALEARPQIAYQLLNANDLLRDA
ncbi:Ribosomal protein S3AE [Pseudomonas syringae pv. tomato]|nr:Ribosomal protein S3AE [Pseudomonas syringae pv. tomato]